MSWLDDFMAATIEAESPRSYFWWSGLVAISAAVSNRVYVNKQIYKLYPNLFVFLIGKSGLRKSGPPAMVRRIHDLAEVVKVFGGRGSIQSIIEQLGKVWTLESGRVLGEAHAFICSTEFAASLVKDDDALTILTDLHDSHYHTGVWRNSLKSGSDTLKQPCLNLLSATNEVHFDDKISQSSLLGGFIARTILVVESKKSRVNDLLDPPQIEFKAEEFVPYIQELSKVKGEMILSPSAKSLFRQWYKEFSSTEIEDKTGTSERIHDRILKVAMNLSLAESTKLIIQESHMIKAMEACLEGVSIANRATMGQGKSELAGKANIFLQRLMVAEGYEMDRKTIISREWGNFDSQTLDKIVETLEQGGLITSEGRGGRIWYRLSDAAIKFYVEKKGEKK